MFAIIFTDGNSAYNSIVFKTHIDFVKKKNTWSYLQFLQTLKTNALKGAAKT